MSKFRLVSVIIISILIGVTGAFALTSQEKRSVEDLANETFADAAAKGYHLGCMEALVMVEVSGMVTMYRAACKNRAMKLKSNILQSLSRNR